MYEVVLLRDRDTRSSKIEITFLAFKFLVLRLCICIYEFIGRYLYHVASSIYIGKLFLQRFIFHIVTIIISPWYPGYSLLAITSVFTV